MSVETFGSVTVKEQKKRFGPKAIRYHGENAVIRAVVRWDDECGNGRNSFSITANIYSTDGRRGDRDLAGGCLHEEVAKHFPELAPYIKWHLCGADGPLHYVQNVVYMAGDKDCWGLRKGEFRQQIDKESGLPLWFAEVKFNDPRTRVASAEKPGPLVVEYKPVGMEGEGKARELDAARRAAVWPDASDEELTAPGLEELLVARLPQLMAEFRRDVESLGFTW